MGASAGLLPRKEANRLVFLPQGGKELPRNRRLTTDSTSAQYFCGVFNC